MVLLHLRSFSDSLNVSTAGDSAAPVFWHELPRKGGSGVQGAQVKCRLGGSLPAGVHISLEVPGPVHGCGSLHSSQPNPWRVCELRTCVRLRDPSVAQFGPSE